MARRTTTSKTEPVPNNDQQFPVWGRICRSPEEVKVLAGPVTDSRGVYELLKDKATSEDQEVFYCVALNTQNEPLVVQEVSRGTLDSAQIHPRDVFRTALAYGAKSVIIAHNHPSGRMEPSPADIEATKALVKAGKIIDIPVLDSLVITHNGYYSMYEHSVGGFE